VTSARLRVLPPLSIAPTIRFSMQNEPVSAFEDRTVAPRRARPHGSADWSDPVQLGLLKRDASAPLSACRRTSYDPRPACLAGGRRPAPALAVDGSRPSAHEDETTSGRPSPSMPVRCNRKAAVGLLQQSADRVDGQGLGAADDDAAAAVAVQVRNGNGRLVHQAQ